MLALLSICLVADTQPAAAAIDASGLTDSIDRENFVKARRAAIRVEVNDQLGTDRAEQAHQEAEDHQIAYKHDVSFRVTRFEQQIARIEKISCRFGGVDRIGHRTR